MVRNLLDRFIYFQMRYPEGHWDAQASWGQGCFAESRRRRVPPCVVVSRRSRSAHDAVLAWQCRKLTHRVEHALAILDAGSSVLVVDYRGYGKSSGVPTERGLYRDTDAAYQWLIDSGFPAQKLILHGESIGSAVAVELAARRECAALVLESPFTSLSDIANTVAPLLGGIFIRGFDTLARIRRVQVPVLVIHGDADAAVPISQGNKVFAAANEPKSFWQVHRAGHNALLECAGAEYVDRLMRTVSRAQL